MYSNKHITGKILLFLVAVIALSSCLVTKKYTPPEITKGQYLFRLDSLSENGTQIWKQDWKGFFKDTLLKTYIDTALVYNHDNLIAFKNIEQFKARFRQGKAGYYPNLNLDVNAQHSELANAPSSQNYAQFTIGANLTWEADIWGKINSQKLAAKAEFNQSITAQKLLQTQLIANIAMTYYQLLEADKRKMVLTETIQIRKQSVNTLQNLKDAGQGNSISVSQAQAQLAEAEILLNTVNNQIFNLESAMILLIGKPVYPIKRSALNDLSIPTAPQLELPLEAIQNRPDVKEAELAFQASFEHFNVARASMYPSLKLSANVGTLSNQLTGLFGSGSFFSTLIGGIMAPIFNGRQLLTQKEVSKLQMEQSLLRFQKQVLNASLEVGNVLQDFNTSFKNLEALSQQESILSQSFIDSKELLNAGLANYLDVLNAQSNLLNTQLQHVQTNAQHLQNYVIIYRALGGGVN